MIQTVTKKLQRVAALTQDHWSDCAIVHRPSQAPQKGLCSKMNFTLSQLTFEDIFKLLTGLQIAVHLISIAAVALKTTSTKTGFEGK